MADLYQRRATARTGLRRTRTGKNTGGARSPEIEDKLSQTISYVYDVRDAQCDKEV